MSQDRPTTVRWWETIEPGTSAELGFVRIDRVGSTSDWDSLPREQTIARRAQYLKLVEVVADGFAAVMPIAWQGDGTMIFVSGRSNSQTPSGSIPESAAATAGLLAITLNEHLLTAGFIARIGAHTGRVAFNADTGKMADREIDRAGHLERECPPGAAALSEDVYLALPGHLRDRCAYLGTTIRDGIVAYVFPPTAAARRDPSRFTPAAEDLVPLERRFLRYLDGPDVRRLRYVGFRLRRQDPPSLDILDVFTPLDVEEHAPAHARIPLVALEAEDHSLFGAPWMRPVGPPAMLRPLIDVFPTARHLVVLGDPGSGKSTLLRWLAVNAGLGRPMSRQRLGMDERLVPLLLPVGRFFELRAALARESAGVAISMLDVIVRYFRERNVADHPEALRRVLLRRLEEGACLVLLDGLDEVPSESRYDLTRWLEDFAASYRENRFVVTSRIFGYAGLNLPDATTVALRPFSDDQVGTYLLAWHRAYRAWESNLSPEAAELDQPASDAQAEQLFRVVQGDARLRALASNPFLLSAIALVHRAEGQLPTHRVQLYEIFSRALCETWDEARRLAAGDRSGVRRIEYETEAIPILGRLAWWLHEHHPAGAAPEEEVRDTLVAALMEERAFNRDEAERAAREFLRRAGEDLQILVPRGPGLFGFMHLTFQEFFTAAYLHACERFEAESRLRWYDARWEEVILLGVGMLAIVQKRPVAASAFVQGVLGWAVPSYPFLTDILQKHVFLAARCAADGPNLHVAIYETTASAFVRSVVHDSYRATRERGQRVLTHVRDTRFSEVILTRLLLELRDDAEPEPRANVAEALGALRDPRAVEALVGTFQQDPDIAVRLRAVRALAVVGDRRAIDPLLTALRQETKEIRQAAADALGSFASSALVETVTELLNTDDALTRGYAVQALGAMRARSRVNTLLDLLTHDPNPFVRGRAAYSLGRLRIRRAAGALIAALNDPDYDVRTWAAWALGPLGRSTAVDALVRAAREDPAEIVRGAATLALSDFNNPHVLDTLTIMLRNDPNDFVRRSAAWSLGWFRDQAATVTLITALADDRAPQVRGSAAEGLGNRGDSRYLGHLLKSLHEDPAHEVRAEVARALGQIGDLQTLQPLLEAFNESPHELVRDGIVEALWALSDRLSWMMPSGASNA